MTFVEVRSEHHQKTILAVLVVVLVLGAGIALLSATDTDSYRAMNLLETGIEPLPEDLRAPLEQSNPLRLRIGKLSIDAPFTALGVDENNEIEVPKGYEEVGWYKHGPTPGELGPSIVLGHVDSIDGPAVFFSLGQLVEGDFIEIDREDGTTATFRVTKLDRYYRNGFPTDMVYGNIDHAGIRLITCSGLFDKESQEYNKVLVVYGVLVETPGEQ